jgi:CoA:oxalate CoA-transferase
VIENFRPGVAARLGLSAPDLCAGRPELVWASISGFGQDGPWRDRPAYDIVVQALSGVMSLTGVPGAPAMRLGVPAGDLVAGLYAAIAVLAALDCRRRTGRGRIADVSMLDGQLSMLSYQAVYTAVGGITPRPQGNRHDSIPTYRSFTAGDGRELVVAANTHRMWVALCGALGVDELVADGRFVTASDRLAHEDQLGPLLERAFLARPAAEWVDELVARAVPSALIKTVPEALDDAKRSGRAMILPVRSPSGCLVETLATPIGYADTLHGAGTYPRPLGADTEAVLRATGYSAERIDELRRQDVFRTAGTVPARDSVAVTAAESRPVSADST